MPEEEENKTTNFKTINGVLHQEVEIGYWGNDGHGGEEFKVRGKKWVKVPSED